MYKEPAVEQLLLGLMRHLTIAQTTSNSKETRLKSLSNLGEVLEYVVHIGYSEQPNELLTKFFTQLLVKVKIASVKIHTEPVKFEEELGFLSTLRKIIDTK